MWALFATVFAGAAGSFLFTRIIGHESTKLVLIIGAAIALPVGLTVDGMVSGHVALHIPVAVGTVLGPMLGYAIAAPFMLGL